ncbi:hypothetical protein NQ318_006384 [Aromia moschata]|uniref:Maelstrom domain-containing protein n=1 Tax=Aromia moschata TaxID=1265417 RepID=A0AAV8YJ70_9CUCU|nr:hypothetical protein NQ318_006384 [Aromia moschata]
MIKPGLLPLGFAGIANLQSKETHQIPPPLADDGTTNMADIYVEMKQFLQSKMEGSKRMPILYCNERDMKLVQDVLDVWGMDYGGGPSEFKVYNLQYMFRILRNTVASDNVWPSDTFSNREIEKDVNAYAKGITCEYHSITDVPVFCSRSIVVRLAYTICDNCCSDLNIQFIPGCHVPDTAISAIYSRASSVASTKSSRSRAGNSSVRDDDSDSVISFSSKSEWETQSVISETSSIAINDEEDFPTLGNGRKKQSSLNSWNRFTPNDSSSTFSQASARSLSGATGKSGLSRRPADMPSSVINSMEKISLISSESLNSTASSVVVGTSRSFDPVRDFPSLERGRGRGRPHMGSRGRGLRRPNDA